MTLEEALEASVQSNAEDNEVIVIDNDLRKITIPESITLLGVESDKNVRALHFQMPKTYKGLDLSEFAIRINYMNANNVGDTYAVDDSEISGENIVFTWTVGRVACMYKGNTKFIVCLKKKDASGNVLKEFNTSLTSLPVLEGLETTEAVVSENPDIIEQILTKIEKLTQISPEDIATAVEEYMVNNPIEETDPTVPDWAKQPEKPSYTALEVGALPAGTKIPSKTSDLQNDSGFTTLELDETLTDNTKAAPAGMVGELKGDIGHLSKEIENLGGGTYSSVEPADNDIPKVFFDEAIPQTKDDVVTKFRYVSKTKDFSGYAEFKAQGNSSMSYPKKNMTVKMSADDALEEKLKVDFKGWGKQRKHVYKANWIDLSHARNVVSARLWADVVKSRADYELLPELLRTSPNQGAVDGFPVKVYSQGIYQGRYTLNIPKDAWMANMDDSLDEHCILCGENYTSGCFRALANINGNDWTDEVHDVVPDSIKTRWNEIITFIMNSTDEEFKANLENYFFADSLIDYFIFGMISCGLDAFGKNQLYFTYDGIKWIASIYDMDSTWGLYWNGSKFVSASYSREEYEDFVSTSSSGDGNLLYIRLASLFYAEIQARYAELKQGALSIPNIINHFERFTDIAPLDLVKEDYASTTGSGKFTGIPSKSTNNIQQIRKFVVDRYVYCDEYFDSLAPIESVPATEITLDKTILTFTDSATQVITATVEPENTTDTVVWSSNNETIATVSNGVVTPVLNGSCTITATVGSVSATCEVNVNVEEEIVTYKITRNLTNCTSSSAVTSINVGTAHAETITADSGYTLEGSTVSVTMNGADISSAFVDGSLTIECVTGDIVINVTAKAERALLYSLPEETVFDGSTKYIDTGLQLMKAVTDLTILVDYQADGTTNRINNQATLIHCMYEAPPYKGFLVDTTAGRYRVSIQGFEVTYQGILGVGDSTRRKMAIRISVGDKDVVTAHVVNSVDGDIKQIPYTTAFPTHESTFVIGANKATDGTMRRYWAGTVYECKVYNYAISDEEMIAYATIS